MEAPTVDDGRVSGLCAAALDALALPVFICDQVKVLFVNGAAASMLRAGSGEEFAGLPVNELLHPDMHAPAEIRRQVLMNSHQPLRGIHAKLSRRDGSSVTILADARPFEFGGESAILFTCGPACVTDGVS